MELKGLIYFQKSQTLDDTLAILILPKTYTLFIKESFLIILQYPPDRHK